MEKLLYVIQDTRDKRYIGPNGVLKVEKLYQAGVFGGDYVRDQEASNTHVVGIPLHNLTDTAVHVIQVESNRVLQLLSCIKQEKVLSSERTPSVVSATKRISLDVDCPHCDNSFDIAWCREDLVKASHTTESWRLHYRAFEEEFTCEWCGMTFFVKTITEG